MEENRTCRSNSRKCMGKNLIDEQTKQDPENPKSCFIFLDDVQKRTIPSFCKQIFKSI